MKTATSPEFDAVRFEIAKLELEPDDILVIRVPEDQFTTEEGFNMIVRMTEIIPKDVKTMILPRDMDLSVIRKGESA